MEVGMMFSAIGLAPAVAKYLGIIEDKLATVEAKVDRLGNSEFEAGVRALLQAGESDTERGSLLREARGRFNRAISLESGVRRANSYLGLALCHKHLDDEKNMVSALTSLVEMPTLPAPAGAIASKAITDQVAKVPFWAKTVAIVAAPVLVLASRSPARYMRPMSASRPMTVGRRRSITSTN